MKRQRSHDLETKILRLIEENPFPMKSDTIAKKAGANIELTRLALMDLSTEKKIKRSGSGCYRVLPPEMHTEHR